MDFKKVIPVAIIALALISLIAYYAFSPPADSGLTNQIPSGPTSNSQTQAPQATQDSSTMPGTTQNTLPANVEPVSSKEPATIVPDNMTLDQYCDKYYKAWLAKDWKTAYEMLPMVKKKDLDPDGLAQRNEAYGLVSAQVDKPVISGNAASVVAQMDLGQNGVFYTTWTFIKNDKGQWTVQDTKTGVAGQ